MRPFYPAWLGAAALVFIFCASVQIFSTWRQSKRERNVSNVLLDEEAAIEWDGILGPNTWTLLVPPRKYKINILIFSLLASVISFLSSVLLRYQVILSFFKSEASAVTVYLACWLTVFVCLQSLLSAAPETATWRHVITPDLQALARPATLILCQSLTYVGIYFWNIFSITNIAYVAQALLPLGWLLGVLPPLDCFLGWAGEQVLVSCYGASHTSSAAILAAQLMAATTQLVLTSLCVVENRTLLIISTVLGYTLSTNWSQVWRILEKCEFYKAKVTPQNHIESNNKTGATRKAEGKPNITRRVSEAALVLQEFITHVFFLTISSLLSLFILQLPSPSLRQTALTFGWIIFALQTALKITQECQKVYLFFGLIRSPVYQLISERTQDSWSGTIVKVIIRFLHPISTSLLLQTFVLLSIITEPAREEEGEALRYLNMLATQRALRWIWQNTDSALFESAMLHVLRMTVSSNQVSDFFIRRIPFAVQLLMTSFLFSRLSECLEKLYLFFCLSASAIEDRASRRPYAFILFQLNVFLFPLIGGIIVITSVLSSPILSMFTLPIFFISYPRPSRFWPGEVGSNAASSTDSIYYQQSLGRVLEQFNIAAKSLRLGALQPESMFLLRFEDKIFWIKILEKGNGYLAYNMKGLELQETSCHSLEATRIDDIFEATFEKRTNFNNFVFHTLTPVTRLSVRMYSDTRNNLTSILTSQDTLDYIAQVLVKVSLWMMIKHRKKFVSADDDVSQPKFDDVIQLTPATVEEESSSRCSSVSGAWAARTLLVTPDVSRHKLATINLPVKPTQTDVASLSDFGDIDDHLRDFEKFLEPVANTRTFVGDKNYFHQMDALPGIVEKSPKAAPANISQGYPSDQTPFRFLESEPQFDQFSLPTKWMLLCEKNNIETGSVPDWFPVSFYNCLLQSSEAAGNKTLCESYVRFVRLIFDVTYGKGASPNNVTTFGPNIVMKNFSQLSVSTLPDDLYAMIQSAFRTAVKIAIDQSVLGELDEEELLFAMEDVLSNWYIGLETSDEWRQSVKKEVPNLFTINCFKSSENRQMMLYKSRILNLKDCDVNVGRLNKEVVKSLWASLSLGT